MARNFKNSVNSIFNKMTLFSLINSIITIIVGICLIFIPDLSNKVIGIITGIIFLLAGANSIYKYIKRDGAKLYTLNIAFGILYLLLGIVIIVFPFSVSEFVTICLGIYVVVNGASKINYGVWLKKGSEESWLVTLVSGILLLIIGILIMFNPFVALTLTRLVGIFLLISGILDLASAILCKQRSKEIIDIFW